MKSIIKNILRQIIAILLLYITGWFFLYLTSIIVSFLPQNMIWFSIIILGIIAENIVLCFLVNRKTISRKIISVKSIHTKYLMNLLLRCIIALGLLIIIFIKENHQMFLSIIVYYEFLYDLLGNDQLARTLSIGSCPSINVANFIILSIGCLSYHVSQILFDKSVHKDVYVKP